MYIWLMYYGWQIYYNRSSKIKKTVEVNGVLGHNATRGNRAVIHSADGPSYYTSKVVDLRNESKTGIEIETLNTIYKIIYPESYTLAEAV